MTVAARRELALRTAVRYKNAARPEKKRILDEFLESTGFHTLVLTDVATGWTECHGDTASERHGSEFMNYGLLAYCERETIQFTRGRARRKNDQCFVEQKNGSIVRQLVGYDRYEGSLAYRQLAELYRVVRLYVNFFQPSMKLTTKTRDGSRVTKRYDIAQTPYQRLSNSDALDPEVRVRLAAIYERSDPVDLLRQLEKLQDAFWRHAKELASPTLTDDIVRAALVSPNCDADADRAPIEAELPDPGFEQRITRRYRKTRKQPVPHTWRTRPDPFDGVWEEMRSWLESDPGRTSKSLLLELQQRRPGRYPNGQLRTLQRRVREWRRQILETFDGEWLELDRVRPASASAGDGGCGKGGRPTASTAGRTLPFDRSFGNIFDEATTLSSVTFLNEAIRPGVLIVADQKRQELHCVLPSRPSRVGWRNSCWELSRFRTTRSYRAYFFLYSASLRSDFWILISILRRFRRGRRQSRRWPR